MTPFPVKPALHVHWNAPGVFRHVTPGVARLQLCSEELLHSFMSVDEDRNKQRKRKGAFMLRGRRFWPPDLKTRMSPVQAPL